LFSPWPLLTFFASTVLTQFFPTFFSQRTVFTSPYLSRSGREGWGEVVNLGIVKFETN
jgi:hypothetical protein